MVQISGGKFFMGADDGNADEKPAHQVTLSPFCMDRHEVTTAEYEACSNAGECQRAPNEVDWKGITPRQIKVYSTLCNARRAERGSQVLLQPPDVIVEGGTQRRTLDQAVDVHVADQRALLPRPLDLGLQCLLDVVNDCEGLFELIHFS